MKLTAIECGVWYRATRKGGPFLVTAFGPGELVEVRTMNDARTRRLKPEEITGRYPRSRVNGDRRRRMEALASDVRTEWGIKA